MRWLLKWKIWRIESAIKILLKSHGITPYVWSFGAVDIDPKHLVFVVGVATDQDKNALKCNQAFLKSLNTLLCSISLANCRKSACCF